MRGIQKKACTDVCRKDFCRNSFQKEKPGTSCGVPRIVLTVFDSILNLYIFRKSTMKKSKLQQLAVDVVDMFDQANTGKTIENLGSRGEELRNAVQRLRKHLNKKSQTTILSAQQVAR